MENTIILNIVGPAQSGKTTLATNLLQYVANQCGTVGKIYSYADGLKQDLANRLELPLEYFHNEPYKSILRPIMQVYGTDVRRNELMGGKDTYWADYLRNRVLDHIYGMLPSAPKIIALPDVRFQTEVDNFVADPDNGVHVLNIRINPINYNEIEHTTHISETGIAGLKFPEGTLVDVHIDHKAGIDSDPYNLVLSTLWSKYIQPLAGAK